MGPFLTSVDESTLEVGKDRTGIDLVDRKIKRGCQWIMAGQIRWQSLHSAGRDTLSLPIKIDHECAKPKRAKRYEGIPVGIGAADLEKPDRPLSKKIP